MNTPVCRFCSEGRSGGTEYREDKNDYPVYGHGIAGLQGIVNIKKHIAEHRIEPDP